LTRKGSEKMQTLEDSNLIDYYAARASEYEYIYGCDDEIRRAEQLLLERAMIDTLRGLNVLEVACGTGFWTERLAEFVQHITAVDAAEETLAVARAKSLSASDVRFQLGDAYDLNLSAEFDGGLSNFWLSHVPKARISHFLEGFHARLRPGAQVFMADNVWYPAATSGQAILKPGLDDAFAERFLQDGSRFKIIKNYFSRHDLAQIFSEQLELKIHLGTCFWWVSYRISGMSN
jgi:2-polyprenyl-3-methyl-5-hydroxy-6-metoxy-1,4-benzoquinol methylase